MKIEKIIKSTVTLSEPKKAILNFTYTHNILADKFNEYIKPFDISREQYNVLRILRGQKGNPVNMSDIQERMLAPNSNTTRLIDKLLKKELVTRKICPANKRKMEILITEKGLDLLAILEDKVIEHEKMFANNLTSTELEQLNILIEKYRTLK